jgi:outer membrane protein insertion porin family
MQGYYDPVNKFRIMTILLCLFFSLFKIGYANSNIIKDVEFRGNNSIKSHILSNLMNSKKSGLFKKRYYYPFILENDVAAINQYYIDEGFISPEIRFEIEEKSNGVIVVIHINEGPRFITRTVTCYPCTILSSEILSTLTTQKGLALIPREVMEDADELNGILEDQGLLFSSVIPEIMVDTPNATADIIFKIYPGYKIRVDSIVISGLTNVNEQVILNELEFEKNDTIDKKILQKSEGNIISSQRFNFVSIEPQLKDSLKKTHIIDTAVLVKVNVKQSKYFLAEYDIGYSFYEKLNTMLDVSYANLFNRIHLLGIQGYFSNIRQGAELLYSIPWFFNLAVSSNLSLYIDRHENVFFKQNQPYYGLFKGISISFDKNRSLPLDYSLQLTLENVSDVRAADTLIPDENISSGNTRSIAAELLYDKRNDLLNTLSGFMERVNVTLAGFGGGTNKFVKITNEFNGYFTINQNLIFSGGLLAGWGIPYGSSSSLPLQDRYYAGGPRSVRGYDYNSLLEINGQPTGGNVALILHLIDFQFPLYWNIKGAVFSDAGYIWQNLRLVSLKDLRYTAGPSLRYLSPLGLIRLDVGIKINDKRGQRARIYLDMGKPF